MTKATLDDLLDLDTLVSVAVRIAGRASLSVPETAIADTHKVGVSADLVTLVRETVFNSADPLGTAYGLIKSPEQRRSKGQTFTPVNAVIGMYAWIEARGPVDRIVDPGAGSGRYILTGLRRHPKAVGIASELDPIVALLLRANATALGVEDRLTIHIGDFRDLVLDEISGRTVFIGNPPYVRHHGIESQRKEWYSSSLKALGHASSQLAGLHLHFFLKTLLLAKEGDAGCFITAAEWLDVNYGQAMRDLMTNGLGGSAVYVLPPEVPVFEDALVSACIACFEPHKSQSQIEFKLLSKIEQMSELNGGHVEQREEARKAKRWSDLLHRRVSERREGFVELGDLFKVSRGQVTGMNSVWVTEANRFSLPEEYLLPAITEAAEIIRAQDFVIQRTEHLRRVVDLPADIDRLPDEVREAIRSFLAWARERGADQGYIAQHRKPWWRVGMKAAPQIVVTYMGRRSPVFALNSAGARIINVAHGLYPRVSLDHDTTIELVSWLNANVKQESGRVYAGGLTKFEPSEVMRLQVPGIDLLRAGAS